MNSLNYAGACFDETCCKAEADESKCRCHISERLSKWRRLRERFDSDSEAMAVWTDRLFLARHLVRLMEEGHISREAMGVFVAATQFPVYKGDELRTEPVSSEEMDRVREMDAAAGMPWNRKPA